ncbi:MAG: hypothetical protein AAB395_02020 [Patescibacteria group bacterium]
MVIVLRYDLYISVKFMIKNYSNLSKQGHDLQGQFANALKQVDAIELYNETAIKVHVAGVGGTISTAYEQLRNAAEYTEEHLLLQRTIRRFYKRNLSFFDKKANYENLGEELIIELTQSGYLQNNSVPKSCINEINNLVETYHGLYWQMHSHRVPADKASGWVLDTLSVSSEIVFNKSEAIKTEVFAEFARVHYRETFKNKYAGKVENYDTALGAAVYKALLKSDQATVRTVLMQQNTKGFSSIKEFINFQKNVDEVYDAKSTEQLVRLINKNGAPLRVLQRLMDESPEVISRLRERDAFLNSYQAQTDKEYQVISKKINRGILKSVAFLFITKVLIGLAIEIPYDYYIVGAIVWFPLVVNLLFPPLYMASLKFSMKLPSGPNTSELKKYVDDLFFETDGPRYNLVARTKSQDSTLLNFMYTAMFLFVFTFVTLRLATWGFSWVHIVIFFLFLSTASFLGFRLSRLISELEMVTTNQGSFAVIRDFLYTPFILVGRWMSDKYSRVNIIALILDMAIELPLKTFLRLLRQWTQFLNDKKDNL